jgi:uncharacterized protein
MNRVALLDVNLLVALFDPDHVHHDLAHDWFADNRHLGWATCPLTENGLVRVLTNPAYRTPSPRAADVIGGLEKFRRSGQHHFWPDCVSFGDSTVFDRRAIGSHRQLTDVYLLALARKMGGRLATFDRNIPLAAIVGAGRDALAVIAPTEATRDEGR